MSGVAASVPTVPSSSASERASRRGRILLPAALVGTALALIGFWPTYFGPLLVGGEQAPRVGVLGRPASFMIHVHAVTMVTWLTLFLAQVWLAASGRVRLHVNLGPWVMGFAIIMIVVGLFAIAEGFTARLATGDVFRAQRWLFGGVRDMVFIVPLVAAGWAFRRRPEIHKRLMLVATVVIISPAIGRMTFLGSPAALWTFMLVWPLPVYLAMAHDFRTRRIVHPVYLIGLAAMLTMRLVLPLNTSPTWHAIAAHVTAFYQPPAGHVTSPPKTPATETRGR
jgi:hypothetical protein